ncbi:EF-hand domain-containing protein [Nocardiopsis sp. HNM0947]|uniref:EF-hand domain-containing protein n=1 Tax=Nocardiopsis coralli TaxID=2772213 RepID=A0ABR9PAW2_9ACTN|nr:EF-hand domain-containing protein [Nocardiopsis coralli]MBE3000975.1 EF-hand domain-containing protein [Nocardiopsis coralli]
MPEKTDYAATFSLVDADGDGLISADEFLSLMQNLGEETTQEQAVAAVRDMDTDGDDRVSLAEFTAYMGRTRA